MGGRAFAPGVGVPACAGARSPRDSLASFVAPLVAALLATFAACDRGWAAPAPQEFTAEEAASAEIEQLMDVQVTTVAGAGHDWFHSPAALYVITGDELRRSGHHTLADALRVVPGVFVGQVNAHSWTVGMRGFSTNLANKTLVLIDGRAVYDPLFGGTFWDVQDVVLSDVDRIEVIRGPGATLWGANAVNGVINVITKSSADTQGLYVKAGGGNIEHAYTTVRYGGTLPGDATWRVFGKAFDHDHYSILCDASGGNCPCDSCGGQHESAHDHWDLEHGGFRVDIPGGARTHYTVQGDLYSLGELGESFQVPVPNQNLQYANRIDTGWANGGNVLMRATHEISPDAGWSLQLYYDRTGRTQSGFHVERDTGDLDFRHHFTLWKRQEIQWGLGERFSADRSKPGPTLDLAPESRELSTTSGFLQDTVTIVPDRVFAMLGTKLEHNSFTGVEVQPSGRLWWTPDERDMLWAAISRPVRVPTRIEQDGFVTLGVVDVGLASGGPPSGTYLPVGVAGNPHARSEKLIAYELGYRRKLTDNLTVDVAPFYNDYSDLLFAPPTIFGQFTNAGSGESYGLEISSMWRAFDRWSIEASYAYVDVRIHGDILQTDQGGSPHHQAKLLSFFDLTDKLELNTGLYYVDSIATPDVPSYVRLDQGLTWHATRRLDVAIWGQNLLDNRHREASAVEVERAFYGELVLHFD